MHGNSNIKFLAVNALYIVCSLASNNWTGNCSNCYKGAVKCGQCELLLGEMVGSGGLWKEEASLLLRGSLV